MQHTIELKDWDWECGDGCCYDYGTELIIDGVSLSKHFDTCNGAFPEILKKLFDEVGVDVKIINTSERNV